MRKLSNFQTSGDSQLKSWGTCRSLVFAVVALVTLAAGVASMSSCGFAAEKPGDGFVPLDWIESTGGQYIDTGVDAGAHTTIDMAFGHCVYNHNSTLFGKDVWDPQGFLFILQHDKFRFFGAKGKEPGAAWNMVAKDETEERDYRFTLGADNKACLFGADGRELCALATDRSTASHHTLWLFKCNSHNAVFGQFRLYAMKIGTDAGETLRDFAGLQGQT